MKRRWLCEGCTNPLALTTNRGGMPAIAGDTAALIFACKTVLGLREPRGDEFNVHVSATATASAKPASFTITEEVKKRLYEAALVIRREALQQNEGRN